ncbi:conserved hypothetical protein [Neospora caninum Liverpool]|uniref:Uncharacterized protein n=1 Tax=Neospora caninum (strain Liverpool) TaxID=572307 RepID=F0VHD8_NEOCL|nr:conserved hypothetical protein [Neospora caninum Liverpool]CBZ53132.1 conserved hypothetical protein [Neospora caninum Liverpool]|eukprot:XP_003883164.1 conserved hypothetical protein [Neospora caninum Liverpool]
MGDPTPVGQAVRHRSAYARSSGHLLPKEAQEKDKNFKHRPATAAPALPFIGLGRKTLSGNGVGAQGRATRRRSLRHSAKLCSVKTFVDLSTYPVGRVQIGGTAPEPGPLLLLFLFYSRLHEHLVNDSSQSSKRRISFFASPYSVTEGKFTIRDAKKLAFDLLLHKPPFALSTRHVEEVWAAVAPREARLHHDPFLAALNLGEFIAFFAGLGVLAVSRVSIPGVTSYFGRLRLFMRRFASAKEVKNLLFNAYRDTHIPALAKYPLNTKTELPTRDLLLALPQGDVRALPSVCPDPVAYRWLLEKFVFSRAKPVWHRFPGAFLDMGIHRHIPSSEHEKQRPPQQHVDAVVRSTQHRFGVQIRNLSHSPVSVHVHLRDLDPVELTIKPKTVLVPGQKVLVTVTADSRHSPGEWFGLLVLRFVTGKGWQQRVKIPVYVRIADDNVLAWGDTGPVPLFSASEPLAALGARRHVAFASLSGVQSRLSRSWRDAKSGVASAGGAKCTWANGATDGETQPAGRPSRRSWTVEGKACCRPGSARRESPIRESGRSASGAYKRRDARASSSGSDSDAPDRPRAADPPPRSRVSARELPARQRATLEREQYLQQLRSALPEAVSRQQGAHPPTSEQAQDGPQVFRKSRREFVTQKNVARAPDKRAHTHCHGHRKRQSSQDVGVRSANGNCRTADRAPFPLQRPQRKRLAAQDRESPSAPWPEPLDSPETVSVDSRGDCAHRGSRQSTWEQSESDVCGGARPPKRPLAPREVSDKSSASSTASVPATSSGGSSSTVGSPVASERGLQALAGRQVGGAGRDATLRRDACRARVSRSGEGGRRLTLSPRNTSRQYQGAALILQTLQGNGTRRASASSSNIAAERRGRKTVDTQRRQNPHSHGSLDVHELLRGSAIVAHPRDYEQKGTSDNIGMQCYRLTRAVTLAASILPPRRHYTPQHLLRARLPAVQHHLAPGGPNSDLVAPSIRRALSAIKGVTASTLKTSPGLENEDFSPSSELLPQSDE